MNSSVYCEHQALYLQHLLMANLALTTAGYKWALLSRSNVEVYCIDLFIWTFISISAPILGKGWEWGKGQEGAKDWNRVGKATSQVGKTPAYCKTSKWNDMKTQPVLSSGAWMGG